MLCFQVVLSRVLHYFQNMQIHEFPGIVDWPPLPGGAYQAGDEFPQDVSMVVVAKVYPVVSEYASFSGEFKGRLHSYDVHTVDEETAKRLAFCLEQLIGRTVDKFGDLRLDS